MSTTEKSQMSSRIATQIINKCNEILNIPEPGQIIDANECCLSNDEVKDNFFIVQEDAPENFFSNNDIKLDEEEQEHCKNQLQIATSIEETEEIHVVKEMKANIEVNKEINEDKSLNIVDNDKKADEPQVEVKEIEQVPLEASCSIQVDPTPETKQIELVFTKALDIDDFEESCKSSVADFICPLCLGVYYNPVTDSNSHIFCQTCIIKFLDHYSKNNIPIKCPVAQDNSDCNFEHIKIIPLINQILLKQTVKCKNRNKGCSWVGKLSQLESHIGTICLKQTIKCPFETCCKEDFRENITFHETVCEYRVITCSDCSSPISFINLENHISICGKHKISCSQCNILCERERLDIHIKEECMNSIIFCPYKDYGCNQALKRELMNNHLNYQAGLHNILFIQKTKDLTEKLESSIENKWKEEKNMLSIQITSLELQLKEVISLKSMQREESLEKEKKESKFEKVKKVKKVNENDEEDESSSSLLNRKHSLCKSIELPKDKKEKSINQNQKFVKCEALKKLFSKSSSNLSFFKFKNKSIEYSSTDDLKRILTFGDNYSNKTIEFGFKLIKSNMLYIGLANKKVVEKNNFIFDSNLPDHGLFVFSSFGQQFNCKDKIQDNQFKNEGLCPIVNDILYVKYFSDIFTLAFKLNEGPVRKLIVTKSIEDDIIPCLVFSGENEEVLLYKIIE